jgi:hypothetical protein
MKCRRLRSSLVWLALSAFGTSPAFAQSRDITVASAEQTWDGVQTGARAGIWLDQGTLRASFPADRRRDLVVGAPGGPGITGIVYIIFGGPNRSGALSLANADAMITGEAAGDLFGSATAAGNILIPETGANPGRNNFVVGAPNANGGKGAVYLFPGAFALSSATTAGSAVFKVVGAAGDQLGAMLATGDLDGDGYREIIIGAPGNNRIYVIKGSPSLSGVKDLSVSPANAMYTVSGVSSLAAGDVTGDNLADLLIGSSSGNVVYLINGQSGSLPLVASAAFTGIDAGDLAGSTIRIADMDGDGHRDVLIGAPAADGPANTRLDAGEVYLLWGGGPLASRSLAAADVTFYGNSGEHLGASIGAGDVNRDTPNDAVIDAGAAASGNGVLYVYYGRPKNQFGTANPDGTRAVDLAVAGQVDRRISSGPTFGPIAAVQVFEVTGEGARDIIVGIPTFNSNTGRVYFTLSPKLTVSTTAMTLLTSPNGSTSGTLVVDNPTTIPITWEITENADWLTVSPASGGAVQGSSVQVSFNASAAGLPAGTYTTDVAVNSTSPDLTMTLHVIVTLKVTQTIIALGTPADGATVTQPFGVAGWALDLSSTAGSGIDAVHIWAVPVNGAPAVFVGAVPATDPRPDVGAAFGHQFDNSGFSKFVTGLAPGTYYLAVFAHNSTTNTFDAQQVITITVQPSAYMAMDTPQNGDTVDSGFYLAGWAIDASSASGPGIDAIHVWAVRASDGTAIFLGGATYGDARADVGAIFGSQFTNSGFHLTTPALASGGYFIAVYAHSTVTGNFEVARGFNVTVR